MNIPRFWAKATAAVDAPDALCRTVLAWGWGDSESVARALAEKRVARLAERIARGEGFPAGYEYADRPVREEIVESLAADSDDAAPALITRNRYGALVLNTARLVFLDIDVPPLGGFKRLLRLLGIKSGETEEEALKRIKRVLFRARRGTFRLYRTAAGFRAMGIDREFDPASTETAEIMQAVGADPAYRRLCKAQQCFCARLTPKPWRCGVPLPPGRHPREDHDVQARFAAWLESYESTAADFSTCRYVDTIGSGTPDAAVERLVETHDRLTGAATDLPLA